MSTRKNAALLLAAAAVVLVAIPAPAFAQFPFFDHGSGLRFQVEPAETEIFIDGYYVGRVDDYDGFFQRLRFPPGEHEIELYLGGYRSVQQKVLVQPGATFRVRHAMAALQPGDTPDARPVAAARPPGATRSLDPGAPGPGGTRGQEFGAYTSTVEIRRGDTTTLNVSLTRE